MSLFKKRKPVVLTEGNALVETIYEICTFLLFTGYFLFYDNRGLQLTCVGIGLFGSVSICISKAYMSRLKLPLNTIWYFLFFILTEISAFWAHSPENSTSYYFRLMVLILLFGLGITQYTDTAEHCEKLLIIYLFSATIIAVVQFIFTPISEWTSGFFGSRIGGNNTNTFGYIVSTGAILAFYFGYVKNKRLFNLFIPLLFLSSVFSSSRKALASVIIGFFLLILFAINKKYRYLHILLLILFSFSVLILLFYDDNLYSIIGFRFESMFGHLISRDTSNDASLGLRDYFIEFAKILFAQSPIYGQGFANFSVLLSTESQINAETYAHNNYWEILADLGIIGFIVYYWFYAVLLVKFIKNILSGSYSTCSTLALTILISQLIVEIGHITMTSFYPQIVMSLIYVCTYASNSQRKFHYSPTKM